MTKSVIHLSSLFMWGVKDECVPFTIPVYSVRMIVTRILSNAPAPGAFLLTYEKDVLDLSIAQKHGQPIVWDWGDEARRMARTDTWDIYLRYTGRVPIGYVPEDSFLLTITLEGA